MNFGLMKIELTTMKVHIDIQYTSNAQHSAYTSSFQ